QKETFLFNTDLKNEQDKLAIKNLQALLNTDDDIIRLRENIKKVAVSKVENGTLTVADLIREINAENQAKQLKSLHEIQLIKRLYEVKNNINK
ncbi:MAG: transporter, partial [Paludibacteraceae bacterium]|nr:transporter [Paludibacteraceae bacterium]